MTEIAGFCDPRFAPVRDVVADNFRERGELGAAVAITLDGEPVVDMWAGWMDAGGTCPWQADTLVDVFSVGKAIAALCVHVLVDRGEVSLDAPVARYWPEFAAAGKGAATVRMLLSHRAGLPGIRQEVPAEAIYDWDTIAGMLAAEEPWWTPGETHGYHTNTFGFLAGELVRRVSGVTLGTFLQREVAGPLGADFHIGVGADEDSRIAEYVFGGEPGQISEGVEERVPTDDEERRFLFSRVYLNPPEMSGIGTVNTRAWRAAEIPSANAHATARGIARIYSALACGGTVEGVRVLGARTLAAATGEASAGIDFVLGRPSRFGLGFQLTQPQRRLGPNPHTFGHFGVGGSLGFADPDARLAFAYTMNRSVPRWQNPRNRALIDATYASLS